MHVTSKSQVFYQDKYVTVLATISVTSVEMVALTQPQLLHLSKVSLFAVFAKTHSIISLDKQIFIYYIMDNKYSINA